MTFAKPFLFGIAVGFALIMGAGAQAADLPTRKAAPAEYMRICNVGGEAGFLLPGSDVCFKISGYITAQIEGGNLKQGYNWAFAPGAASVASAGPNNTRDSVGWSVRARLAFDARQDTAYGELRGHVDVYAENGNGFDSVSNNAYINRAYVQWAGLTVGKANSFFSFFGCGEAFVCLFSPDQRSWNQPDLFAYTASLGGGFKATIAAQSSGDNGNSGPGTNSIAAGNAATLGMQAPDIVAALRVDQGWGSAQVSGVAHQVRAVDASGAPGPYSLDRWGWGVLGGVGINLPSLGVGDEIQLQGEWTQSALWYSGIPNGMWGENGAVNGNGLPMVVADAWSNGNGTWATPTAWSIVAQLEHNFSQQVSFFPAFGYAQLHWSGLTAPGVIPSSSETWMVGGTIHWDPVDDLDFAWELFYQETHQSVPTGVVLVAPVAAFPKTADGFAGRFYITRDF
jgi:hypothetical protein